MNEPCARAIKAEIFGIFFAGFVMELPPDVIGRVAFNLYFLDAASENKPDKAMIFSMRRKSES